MSPKPSVGHCVVFLDKTLYTHSPVLSTSTRTCFDCCHKRPNNMYIVTTKKQFLNKGKIKAIPLARLLPKEIFQEPKPLFWKPRINLTWSMGGGGGLGRLGKTGGGWSEL